MTLGTNDPWEHRADPHIFGGGRTLFAAIFVFAGQFFYFSVWMIAQSLFYTISTNHELIGLRGAN